MQIEKINIKNFAKNLASCVKTYGVENISHSAALNMASRILGIKDYNTFKSMEREITVINKDEEKDKCEIQNKLIIDFSYDNASF